MGKVGLFFGSFNPIHEGHLSIVRYLLEEGYCESIRLIVSPQNPWKKNRELLEEQKRLELVQNAIANDERMEVCDVEFGMPRPSYTYQTLRKLRTDEPGMDFALIIGGDNLQKFQEWKNFQEILSSHTLFVYPRPGTETTHLPVGDIVLVNAPQTAISSTEIRRKVAEGESIVGEVPENVRKQIETYYKNQDLF
jgi:nicotinate-nucleotide adenylyltransferase